MNKRRMLLWMLPGLTFTAVVFAGNGGGQPTRFPQPMNPASGETIVVHIVGRDHTITAFSTPRGPVYTVVGRDGTVMADHLSIGTIRVQLPAVFREIGPTVAGTKVRNEFLGMIDTAE